MKEETSSNRTIPEDVVEAAWMGMADFSEEQARREIARLSRDQGALLAFVTAFSEDLGDDAQELGVSASASDGRTGQVETYAT